MADSANVYLLIVQLIFLSTTKKLHINQHFQLPLKWSIVKVLTFNQ